LEDPEKEQWMWVRNKFGGLNKLNEPVQDTEKLENCRKTIHWGTIDRGFMVSILYASCCISL
jgi:hypothetical protein